jgi:hypothetical protein
MTTLERPGQLSSTTEKRLTVAVFLDVAKAFDSIWISGFILKLMILNFPTYLIQKMSTFVRGQMFEASFQTAMSSCPVIRVWVAQVSLISAILVSLQ